MDTTHTLTVNTTSDFDADMVQAWLESYANDIRAGLEACGINASVHFGDNHGHSVYL